MTADAKSTRVSRPTGEPHRAVLGVANAGRNSAFVGQPALLERRTNVASGFVHPSNLALGWFWRHREITSRIAHFWPVPRWRVASSQALGAKPVLARVLRLIKRVIHKVVHRLRG
jgi:hypothetical protein